MSETSPPTVLITGSSGFLGQAITHGLLGRCRVIGLDVRQPREPLESVDTFEVDLTSDESVAGALAKVRRVAGGKIASVIHLAAYYDTTGEDNPKYDQVTVQGTRRLLGQFKAFETEQFVFSSTMLVHAPSPEKGVKINENSPIDPSWAYPRSKVETEALIHRQRGDIKTVILRFAGVYDEDCRAAFVAQQIARIFERRPTAYLFTGDITHGQPYLHRDDLVDAVVRTVDRRAVLPEETVLLIGEAETPSDQDMQQRLGELIHGERWHTLSLPKGVTRLGSWLQCQSNPMPQLRRRAAHPQAPSAVRAGAGPAPLAGGAHQRLVAGEQAPCPPLRPARLHRPKSAPDRVHTPGCRTARARIVKTASKGQLRQRAAWTQVRADRDFGHRV